MLQDPDSDGPEHLYTIYMDVRAPGVLNRRLAGARAGLRGGRLQPRGGRTRAAAQPGARALDFTRDRRGLLAALRVLARPRSRLHAEHRPRPRWTTSSSWRRAPATRSRSRPGGPTPPSTPATSPWCSEPSTRRPRSFSTTRSGSSRAWRTTSSPTGPSSPTRRTNVFPRRGGSPPTPSRSRGSRPGGRRSRASGRLSRPDFVPPGGVPRALGAPDPRGLRHSRPVAPTAADRATAILREVQSAGEVTVEELAERLGVSPPTIRRDLSSLDAEGLLRRTQGARPSSAPSTTRPSPTTRPTSSRKGSTPRRSAASAWPLPIWWATGKRSA